MKSLDQRGNLKSNLRLSPFLKKDTPLRNKVKRTIFLKCQKQCMFITRNWEIPTKLKIKMPIFLFTGKTSTFSPIRAVFMPDCGW